MEVFQMYLIDRKDVIIQSISEQDLLEAIENPKINGNHGFTFTLRGDHDKAEDVREGNFVAFLDEENDFQKFEIIKVRDQQDETTSKRAKCVHFSWELNDEEIIKDLKPRNAGLAYVYNQILSKTRIRPGNIANLGNQSLNFYRESPKSCISKMIDLWGGEVKYRIELAGGKVTGHYIDHKSRLGSNTGKRIEYQKDMLEMSREGDIEELKTALYGFGHGEEIENENRSEDEDPSYTRRITFADVEWKVSNGNPVDKPLGQWWIGDPEAIQINGRPGRDGELRHRFGTFEDQDEENPAVLLQKTWNALQNQKNAAFQYNLKIIDLYRLLGYEHEKLTLGDTIGVINTDIRPQIEVSVRVIEMEKDKLSPANDRIVLGQFLRLFTDEDPVISKIKSDYQESGRAVNDPIISDRNYPDIQPPTPEHFQAEGMFQTILLKWNYNASNSLKGWEVYASQVPETVKNPENRVAVTRVNTYALAAGTNETYYVAIRAMNRRGRVSEWSPVVEASTVPVRTPEILFGEETAQFMKDGLVRANMLADDAEDRIQQIAKTYTDEEIETTRSDLSQRIAQKVEQGDVDQAISGLVRDVDYQADRTGYIDRFESNETSINQNAERFNIASNRITQTEGNIEDLSADLGVEAGRISAALERITTQEDAMDTARTDIDAVAGKVSIKVSENDIIASLNISPEEVRIGGDRIYLSGETLMEDGIIGRAAIAEAAIDRFHLREGIIEEVHIRNETVTDSKIKNLSADKVLVGKLIGHTLEAGVVRGTDIYTSRFYSIDSNDSFVQTRLVDSRLTSFGYYTGNSYDYGRMQIGDGRMVIEKIASASTSASSTDSLSFHPDRIFKTQRQSDGSLLGRGQIFFAADVSVIEMIADNVKFEGKAEINGDIKNDSTANEMGNLTVTSLGVNNRLRAASMVSDTTVGFLPQRNNHSDALYLETRDNYQSMNLIYKSSRLKIDNDSYRWRFLYANSTGYQRAVAAEFITASDLRRKTDVEEYTEDALAVIQQTPTYRYNMIGENGDPHDVVKDNLQNAGSRTRHAPTEFGLIAQYAPSEIIDVDRNGDMSIKQYAMNAYTWRAIQQLADENDALKERIKTLEEAIA